MTSIFGDHRFSKSACDNAISYEATKSLLGNAVPHCLHSVALGSSDRKHNNWVVVMIDLCKRPCLARCSQCGIVVDVAIAAAWTPWILFFIL